MTADLEERVARSLHEWADGVPVRSGDAPGAIALARRRHTRRRRVVIGLGAAAVAIVGLLLAGPSRSTVRTAGNPDGPPATVTTPMPDVPHWTLPGWQTTYFIAL